MATYGGQFTLTKGMPVADKYDGAGGKVKYCRYTDIYKVAVVGGDAGYLITGISK
ncbi:hypothetical protein QS821_02265 [Escherichia coli]|uniref:hypothetical protein n=1 Tax=Escherichia coli TaxID=562 RepID=UPI001C777C52|nr:hypothetical protein [Escherichia coli]MDL7557514.1 hypothetical protein [Escherichia coli]MDL7603012.1 hypothetical protein [Escherichia coli]MDL8287421.1 hypothetical protein [Escherichia coli]MDL8828368.1 hypothetical protein [Escherichia coli]MDL9104905.1 hypothetical protein [Escherichia coli]